MKKLLLVTLCIVGLNACASVQTMSYRQIQEKKLAAAVRLQNKGQISAAMESLISLCGERGLSGVTDEALFRLSLLYLVNGPESDKESLQLARQGFNRLQKEYPSSPWTGMAAPVADFLSATGELRKQNQNCKAQNQSLTRDNQALSKETQELRENIEKLKRLDLELEQKRR